MDSDKVLALARKAGMSSTEGDEAISLRFAALIEQALIAEGWRSPVSHTFSPYVSPPKFGQCLICGANHGGLACPDSNVTSKERK